MSSTATTTLTADDVRRLVMSDLWCPKCSVVTSNSSPFDGGTCKCQPDHEDVIADPNAGALLVSEDYPRSAVIGSRRIVRCHKPTLFTRCRCQPEGLSWRPAATSGPNQVGGQWSSAWCLDGGAIPIATAIDIILMSIARDGKKAFIAPPQAIQQKYYDCLVDAIMSADLPGVVAARQRLKDLEGQT